MPKLKKEIFLSIAIVMIISIVSGYCQDGRFLIKGIVLDEITQNPIPGVTIQDSISGKGAITDNVGEFNYEFDDFPLNISLSHLGYFTDSLLVGDEDQYEKYIKGKTFTFTLRENLFNLDEVVVSAAAIRLFDKEPYAIMDYVIKNDRFIALGYRNYNPLKRELFIGKPPGRILSFTPLPSADTLYQDCQGFIYAITRKRAFLISIQNDTLGLNPVSEANFFVDQVMPIQSIDNRYFTYVEKSIKGQYHDYFISDSETGKHELFYRVGDHNNEGIVSGLDRQIRGEFMWNIKQGFIPGGALRAMHERLAKAMVKKSSEYKPVQSDFFQIGDSALLFDYYNNYINCFELNSQLLWRTEILIDLSKDFTGRVHHDKVSNRYFLEFLNVQSSYLIEIDPYTGKELSRIPILSYRHIEHISVHDNRVFFLHQPDFGDRSKKLYYVRI